MFGMGGSEIIVILIVALLFLGPDKLPEAAKQISKGIRDIKKQSRVLQQSIEDDEHIGGAIRDLKSALRGDEPVIRKPPPKLPAQRPPEQLAAAPTPDPVLEESPVSPSHTDTAAASRDAVAARVRGDASSVDGAWGEAPNVEVLEADVPRVRLPGNAGEMDPAHPEDPDDDAALASMVRPASGAIARE